MASFHNWTGDEEIDTQVPQFLNEDNTATQEKLDTKFNKSLDITEASDLNNFKDEGFYCCNSNSRAETILNCPTNYAFGLMVWGKGEIVYQEVREYNRSSKNQEYNNCWRRSYYSSEEVQGTWSKWQKVAYTATTLEGYGITDGMCNNFPNRVSVTDVMQRDINTSYLRLMGGTAVVNGAALQLCGGAYTGDIADAGQFSLSAMDSTHSAVLLGNPSGLLKWNDKNIVRSVNNSVADDDGNVNVANMTGASDSAAGKAGLVPIPTAGKQDMALCGDATFKVLPITGGGTGADNATSALSNLGILGAIVNASVSGTTITFTKKDNTKFSINTQDTNNGIVAALLEQNGYIKFANGLILQWGTVSESQTKNIITVTFPIAFTTVYSITCSVTNSANTIGEGFYTSGLGYISKSTTGFTYKNPQDSIKCGKNWMAIGK